MNEKRLTEGEVQEILDRATQLEREGDGLTPEELIEVGIEAGFSRRAMEQAVEENRLPEQHRGDAWITRGLAQRLMQAGGVGSLVGASTALGYALEWQALVGGSVFLGIPLLVVLAVAEGGRRAHASFQLGNAGYWTGYLLALAILSPAPAMDWFMVVIPVLATLLALVGAGIVEGRWRIGRDTPQLQA